MIIKQFLLLRLAAYGNQTILSTQPVAAEYRSRRRTAPDTISRSRYMVGAHQNLNGSRDLTTPVRPLHGWFVVCRLGLATINMHTKFELDVSSLSRSRGILEGTKIYKNSSEDEIANVNVLRRHCTCTMSSFKRIVTLLNLYALYKKKLLNVCMYVCRAQSLRPSN